MKSCFPIFFEKSGGFFVANIQNMGGTLFFAEQNICPLHLKQVVSWYPGKLTLKNVWYNVWGWCIIIVPCKYHSLFFAKNSPRFREGSWRKRWKFRQTWKLIFFSTFFFFQQTSHHFSHHFGGEFLTSSDSTTFPDQKWYFLVEMWYCSWFRNPTSWSMENINFFQRFHR